MRVAYWKTEECSLNQLLVDLSPSAHLLSQLTQRLFWSWSLSDWAPRSPGSAMLGAQQQWEPLPLQRSLSQRDGADVGAAANTVAGASGRSRIFEWGGEQVPKARGSRRCRHRGVWGVWGGRGAQPLPPWGRQGLCPSQCYFSYDFLVIVIVIVIHFLSF